MRGDTIWDFSHAQGDRIDLSAIDANSSVGGNQAFTFIGAANFTGTAEEDCAIPSWRETRRPSTPT